MSIILGRHIEKMDKSPALISRVNVDENLALIIDANAHVSGTLVHNENGVYDTSVESGSITPASGGYSDVRYDMKPAYLSNDTFPTFVAGANGSSSYFDFNGTTDALVTTSVGGFEGARISEAGLGEPSKRSQFATSISVWIRDGGMVTGSETITEAMGTGSNLQHSKIWSFEDDHIAMAENSTNATMYNRMSVGDVNNTFLHVHDNGGVFDNSTATLSGSLNGADVPFNGAVFGYVAENATGSNAIIQGMSNVSHSLVVSSRPGYNGVASNDRGYGEAKSGSFGTYISGSDGSAYQHIGSPVSGSVITVQDHSRPGLEFEFDVIDVQNLVTGSNFSLTGHAKVLRLHETVRVNGVSTPWSGSENSPYVRSSAGGGNHALNPVGSKRIATFKLASKTDTLEFYQNGYSNIELNGSLDLLKKSAGWVNYTVVCKATNNSSTAGQQTFIYKNAELIQTLNGIGRFIGDRLTSSVGNDGTVRTFYIGRSSTANKSYWKGKMAFCAVYNKELSASDVKANYYALKDRYIGK